MSDLPCEMAFLITRLRFPLALQSIRVGFRDLWWEKYMPYGSKTIQNIFRRIAMCLLSGNESMISQFYKQSGASLINDDSLDADLDRNSDKRLWKIKIKGKNFRFLQH